MPGGRTLPYPVVKTVQQNHICHEVVAPADVSDEVAARAREAAVRAVEATGAVGVVGVELFLLEDGRVLVNELAPRPHNSGHWTLDGSITSQFEQLVRAICGLPLGSPERHSDAVMKNLIGADVEKWREALAEPNAKLHLYGKGKAIGGSVRRRRIERLSGAIGPASSRPWAR